jgi:hypothetical protein
VILVVCLPRPLEHRSHPYMDSPIWPCGSSGVHTEDNNNNLYDTCYKLKQAAKNVGSTSSVSMYKSRCHNQVPAKHNRATTLLRTSLLMQIAVLAKILQANIHTSHPAFQPQHHGDTSLMAEAKAPDPVTAKPAFTNHHGSIMQNLSKQNTCKRQAIIMILPFRSDNATMHVCHCSTLSITASTRSMNAILKTMA